MSPMNRPPRCRDTRPPLLLCGVLLGLGLAPVGAYAGEAAPPTAREAARLPAPDSVHAADLARHQDVAPRPRPFPPRRWAGRETKSGPRVDRVVYGYFPYWASGFDELRWDLLTHIAYFAVGIDGTGQVTERHGWPDPGFVATAHANGVKVELTITLFSGAQIAQLCGTAERRAAAVATIVREVRAGGADGASIDFEGLPAGTRDGFSLFIEELRQGFVAAGQPDAGISIAGPAVDWSDSFDLARLLQSADLFFIMGYGYHWRDSADAGPVGQLRLGPTWRGHLSWSMARTIAVYSRLIGEEQRGQLVWGVPYYGTTWTTHDREVASATVGFIRNPTFSAARAALADETIVRRWEPDAANPWYVEETAGVIHQTWYDDEESLGHKYQLLREQGLGVGMWALGYDVGRGELWDLLADLFAAEPEPALPGTIDSPLPIDSFPFTDQRDTRTAPASHFNYYGCAPQTHEYGREFVYSLAVCQPGVLTVEVTDDAGVDVDIQLLDAPRQESCLARHDRTFTQHLAPGPYWLTADTYVADLLEQPGPYTLTVDFVPDPGSAPCPAGTRCQEGSCQPVTPPDLGPPDGGAPDLGRPDDAGEPGPDASRPDRDTGGPDPDADEPPRDAGEPPPDASRPPEDAGEDGGEPAVTDLGAVGDARPDAGHRPRVGAEEEGFGCSCSSTPDVAASLPGLLLGGLALLAGRRRGRDAGPDHRPRAGC